MRYFMRQVWLPYVDCLVCLVCLMLVGHGHGHELFHTDGAWAVLEDGGVTTWGDPARGGDSSAVEEELTSGVVRVFATMGAFSALKSDGSVISWGKASEGGSSSNLHRVVKLAASAHAFAALREDGSVTFWGSIGNELSFDELNQEQSRSNHFLYLQPKVMPQEDLMHLIADVVDVVASTDSFACLKQDGTIYEWDGDVLDKVCDSAGSSIHQLVGGYFSFAALRSDGSVWYLGSFRIWWISTWCCSGFAEWRFEARTTKHFRPVALLLGRRMQLLWFGATTRRVCPWSHKLSMHVKSNWHSAIQKTRGCICCIVRLCFAVQNLSRKLRHTEQYEKLNQWCCQFWDLAPISTGKACYTAISGLDAICDFVTNLK